MKIHFQILSAFCSIFLVSEVHSISNYEILKICRKERVEKECVKRLKLNRELLNQGKPIRIPVLKYKVK